MTRVASVKMARSSQPATRSPTTPMWTRGPCSPYRTPERVQERMARSCSGTGSYTYTLNNASALVQSLSQGETEVEVFTYTARDNASSPLTDGATISITVAGLNDAPILVTPLADQNGAEGAAFAVTVPAGTFYRHRSQRLPELYGNARERQRASLRGSRSTRRRVRSTGTPATGSAGAARSASSRRTCSAPPPATCSP